MLASAAATRRDESQSKLFRLESTVVRESHARRIPLTVCLDRECDDEPTAPGERMSIIREDSRFHHLRDMAKRAVHSKLLWGGVLSLVIQFQFQIVRLASGVLLARLLGPVQLGIYSFTMSLVQLVQVIPAYGVDSVIIRYSALYRMREAWEFLRGLRNTALLASFGYGVATAFVLLALYAFGWAKATAAVSPMVLAIAAMLMLFRPILTYLGAVLRVENPGVIGQLPKFAVQPWLFLSLMVAWTLAARSSMNAASAVCAQGLAAVATVAVAAFWLVKHTQHSPKAAKGRHDFSSWARSASSFWLLGGLELICTQVDMLLLGTLGTAREAGIYRVATNGANLLLLSAAAVNLYVGPKIPELYARDEHVRLQRMLSFIARGAFVASFVVACVFWIFGRELLSAVFGVVYASAFWPLAILSVGQLSYVASGPSGLLLGMTGHERESAGAAGIAAIFNIALNVVLIPRFGAIGAALATVSAVLIWRWLLAVRVQRTMGLRVSIFS